MFELITRKLNVIKLKKISFLIRKTILFALILHLLAIKMCKLMSP